MPGWAGYHLSQETRLPAANDTGHSTSNLLRNLLLHAHNTRSALFELNCQSVQQAGAAGMQGLRAPKRGCRMLARTSAPRPAAKRAPACLAPVSGMKSRSSSRSSSSGQPPGDGPGRAGGSGFRLDVGVCAALPPASHLPCAYTCVTNRRPCWPQPAVRRHVADGMTLRGCPRAVHAAGGTKMQSGRRCCSLIYRHTSMEAPHAAVSNRRNYSCT